MTQDALARLRGAHAFDPAPRQDELYALHVPFDELTGTRTCEAALDGALRGAERVALVGASGAGKSSVTAHVLGPLVEGLAPLAVPVALEAREVAVDPVAFAGHLVRSVARTVEHAHPRSAGRARAHAAATAPPTSHRRRRRFSIAPEWMGTRAELAIELEAVVSAPARPGAQVLEQARSVLALIAAHDLQPVLVLDDTDKWLQAPWMPDAAEVRAGFFGRVVRLLGEELSVAAVVAVHTSYLADPAYRAAGGFLETTIEVPALPSAAALGAVLARRAELAGEPRLGRVIEPDAVEAVHAHYRRGRSPDLRRRVLFVVHTALAHACDAGASRIEASHVDLAIAETSPDEL